MFRRCTLTVFVLACVACSVGDDVKITSLDSSQSASLCAETCAGREPYEKECDGLTFSTDEDEEGCNATCVAALASFKDCDKTAGDWRAASAAGADSTCDELGAAFAESLGIVTACTEVFDET